MEAAVTKAVMFLTISILAIIPYPSEMPITVSALALQLSLNHTLKLQIVQHRLAALPSPEQFAQLAPEAAVRISIH